MKSKVYTVHKAQPVNADVPDLTIVAADTILAGGGDGLQLKDAEKIVEALSASLPGGTLDKVFGLLAMQRASSLCVTRRSLGRE